MTRFDSSREMQGVLAKSRPEPWEEDAALLYRAGVSDARALLTARIAHRESADPESREACRAIIENARAEANVSLTDESIKLESLEDCARCGCTHAGLRFFKLERPMRIEGVQGAFTHWAMCPGRREPIMMNADLLSSQSKGNGRGEADA